MQRNDELARRAILPDSSRWNQRLIRHAKISKMRRVQISQEQAIVDRLLRRVSRRDTRVRTYAPRGGGRVAIVMPWTSAVVVSAVMCVISLHIFETIARQIDGPMYLARFAIASSLVVTTSAYLVALRRATE